VATRMAVRRRVGDNRPMATTVLIVDDHPSFRASARRMLEAGGYNVVGEAEDGASALAATRELRPEVVLLDVQLPDANGFDLAEEITQGNGSPMVVMTSSRDAEDYADLLVRSAARGFVPKSELTGPALAALLR
jgi:DNA-binding NarL/FixJ family response regulator